MRRLRKLPKEVKALSICNVLEENMREFKDSIPLFADLKNDALRDRYHPTLALSTITHLSTPGTGRSSWNRPERTLT